MVRNKDARRYLREVRALLPGVGKQKKGILNQINGMVADYLEENPEAAYDDIVSRLGSPNQIAASCLEEMEPADVLKLMRTKKRIFCTVVAAALAVVLLWAGIVFAAYQKHVKYANGYFVEDFAVVDTIDNVNGE